MGIKANWFVGVDDEPAPGVTGALPPVVERVEDVGVPLDLREDDVVAQIARCIKQEAALFNQGITCPVRDRADTSCNACAFAHHEDDGHPLQPLCHVGRECEKLLTNSAYLTLLDGV